MDLLSPGEIEIARICGQRDAAINKAREAADLIARGHELAAEAYDQAREAANGAAFSLVDRSKDGHFKRLFEDFDPDASMNVFRSHTDACVWVHLFRVTGLEHLMDATSREQFIRDLSTTVPEVNEANLLATLRGLRDDANLIFQRGLARAFSDLDRRFKSHDAFKLGARIILEHVFDSFGSVNHRSKTAAMIGDVERVLSVLDGKAPDPGALMKAINDSRKGFGPRQGVVETPYLRVRTFKNGNAHLWFVRDDLVEKANRVLADYYGAVLPDAVPSDDRTPFTKSGLPARDLSFYPSPPEVVRKLVDGLNIEPDARVLEPSAGDGAIVRELIARGYTVEACEIDPDRVAALSRIRGVILSPGNFLQMPEPESPAFDAVVMNPPFYGTHWMEHVAHAFSYLKPGGVLRTVLPATAEVSESPKHVAFRAWAERRSAHGRLRFEALPTESFAASGTRINTVILELYKR